MIGRLVHYLGPSVANAASAPHCACQARTQPQNTTPYDAQRLGQPRTAFRAGTTPKMLAPSHFIGFGDLAGDRKANTVPANWRDGIPDGDERLRGGPFHRDPRPRSYTAPRPDFTPSTQVKGGPPAYAHLMGNPCEWSLMSCDRGPSQAAKGFRSPVGWQRGLHPDVADKLYDASLKNDQAVYERFAKNVRDLFKDGAPQRTYRSGLRGGLAALARAVGVRFPRAVCLRRGAQVYWRRRASDRATTTASSRARRSRNRKT